jgi:hypothetical protein
VRHLSVGSLVTISLVYKYLFKLVESPSDVECKVHVIWGCW